MEVIAIGSLVGYGIPHRPPFWRLAFYTSHHVVSALVAGSAFVLASEYLPSWLISSFHLPAVAIYVVVYSLLSTLMVSPLNARIVQGLKLPKAEPLYTVFLAPIALIVYYFAESRDLTLTSLLILALPLVGVLVTFRLYINIDTTYGEVKQLYEISQEFVAAMSQEETVQKIGESISQAISELVPQLDACLLYIYNHEASEYLLTGEAQGQDIPRTVIPGFGLLGRIAFEGTGKIANAVVLEDALGPEERRWPAKTSLLVHPLSAEQQQVGLLVLVRYRKGFTAEEFRLVGIVANQAGVTLHNAQLYEQSRNLADRDRLLDVLNQAAFAQQAQRILSRARMAGQPVALLYPDIDDFRRVNNTFGHPTGDRVLVGIAAIMKQLVGETGIVGRSAGEEFFVLLPNTDEEQAIDLADKIRQRVQDTPFFADDGQEVYATISTGVAIFPRDAGDFETLKKQADRAAYLAKRMGKNRVCLYEDRKEFMELLSEPPSEAVTSTVPEKPELGVSRGHAEQTA
jgi:diguanylate cyclase (GGDEF)-like protein